MVQGFKKLPLFRILYLIVGVALLINSFSSLQLRNQQMHSSVSLKIPVEKVRTNVTRLLMRSAFFRTNLNDHCSKDEEFSDSRFRYEKPVSFQPRIDVVIAAHQRNGTSLLTHLEKCLPSNSRVYVYVAIDPDELKDHDVINLSSEKLDSSGVFKTFFEYESFKNSSFEKVVRTVPNSGSDEATAYFTHLSWNYDDLSPYTAFLHDHLGSWHSSEPCKLLHCGLRVRGLSQQPFIELNDKWYSGRRCISARPNRRKGLFGLRGTKIGWYLDKDKEEIYVKKKWSEWTAGEPTPKRVTSWCCAQFLVTPNAIRTRPKRAWKSLREASIKTPRKGWEILWETLLDQKRTEAAMKC